MTKSYLPAKDADLKSWTANFVSVGLDNATVLGISPDALSALGTLDNTFGSSLNDLTTLKASCDSGVKLKDNQRAIMKTDVRALVKSIQAHPGVPDSLKKQLGITASDGTINRTPPVSPTTVVVNGLPTGVNTLKWKALGNKSSTQYVVQAKAMTVGVSALTDTGWMMVGQTTKRKFDHTGIVPGAPTAYRVIAARSNMSSSPSLPVTIYTS